MIEPTSDGILLKVHVIPRASKPGVAGTRNGAVVVRLNAPPVDGAANNELINMLARVLEVPRRSISIVVGERGRTKTLRITGRTVGDAARMLEPSPAPD